MEKKSIFLTLFLSLLALLGVFTYYSANDSMENPAVVSDVNNKLASRLPSQNQLFYVNGSYWLFYGDNSKICYRTSVSGEDWSEEKILMDYGGTSAAYFDVEYYDNGFSFAVARTKLIYVRTRIENDEIKEVSKSTISHPNSMKYNDPELTVDSDGNPWIATFDWSNKTDVFKSDSLSDWTTDFSVDYSEEVFEAIIPVELNGETAFVSGPCGSAGEAEDDIQLLKWNNNWVRDSLDCVVSEDFYQRWVASSYEENVYVAYKSNNGNIVFSEWDENWTSKKIISEDVSHYSSPVISIEEGNPIVLWSDGGTIHYRARTSGWTDTRTLLEDDLYEDYTLGCSKNLPNGKTGIYYVDNDLFLKSIVRELI